MRSYKQYLIEEAERLDQLAHSGVTENSCENRKRAFEARKKARQDEVSDRFELHTESSIEGSLSLFESLSSSGRLDENQKELLEFCVKLIRSKK